MVVVATEAAAMVAAESEAVAKEAAGTGQESKEAVAMEEVETAAAAAVQAAARVGMAASTAGMRSDPSTMSVSADRSSDSMLHRGQRNQYSLPPDHMQNNKQSQVQRQHLLTESSAHYHQ